MGLDVYLYEEGHGEDLPLDEQEEELPTAEAEKLDDSHLFSNEYLRSSYNDSGFNRIAQAKTSKDLWTIFEPCGDLESGEVHPSKEQLQLARKRAVDVFEELKDADTSYTMFEGFNTFRADDDYTIKDAHSALEAWHETMDDHQDKANPFGMTAFSNAHGTFYTEGFEIKALLPGFGPLDTKGVWVIYDIDLSFYIEAARRTIVFIDTALAMKSPKITWSY